MGEDSTAATRILLAARAGDQRAANQLLEMLYTELRSRARALLQHERPDHTLEPTALVHEAYMRLVRAKEVDWAGRTHFFALAAQAMRRILVDHARAKQAKKRDSDGQPNWSIATQGTVSAEPATDGDALIGALEELGTLDERAARVVELRFLGGLTEADTATVLGISERTVRNDWVWARIWLRRKLGGR